MTTVSSNNNNNNNNKQCSEHKMNLQQQQQQLANKYQAMFDYSLSTPWYQILTIEWSSKRRNNNTNKQQKLLMKYQYLIEWNNMNTEDKHHIDDNNDHQIESNIKRRKLVY